MVTNCLTDKVGEKKNIPGCYARHASFKKINFQNYHCRCSSWTDLSWLKSKVYNFWMIAPYSAVETCSKETLINPYREEFFFCWDEWLFFFFSRKTTGFTFASRYRKKYSPSLQFRCNLDSFLHQIFVLFVKFDNVLRFSVIFVRHHQQNTVFHTQNAHKFCI